jgi:hypothetical protein
VECDLVGVCRRSHRCFVVDAHWYSYHRVSPFYVSFRLEDLVAHEGHIINIITDLIDSDNLPHLLILYGPPGMGKTSTIVAAAKRMYGRAYSSMMLVELT